MANVSKIQLPSGDIYVLEDSAARSALSDKQDKLVSGTNIKTVNSNSLVGSGNVSVGTITGVTAGSGLSGGGTSGSVTLNHSNSVTAGTIGSSSATSGSTVSIPYATYDSNGHITGKGTHTHTITGFFSKDDILSVFYPVGSYYETSDTTFNPNTAWGGTWVLETAGQFHVSAGTGYAAGSTGGSADAIVPYHRHSVAKVTDAITGGAHTHDIENRSVYSGSSNYIALFKGGTGTSTNAALSETHTHDLPAHNTDYEGTSGNTTGANMPPYIAVNRWHRTA